MKNSSFTFKFLRGLRNFAGYVGATWTQNYIGSWMAGYASTDMSRKEVFNSWRPRPVSSQQLLGASLGQLSAQCRHLERTTPLGRAVVEGLVADVVGSGIGLQPNTGEAGLDLLMLRDFNEWAETAMVDGRSLWQAQAVSLREMGTSGGGLARWVWMPERAAKGLIPLALLPIEIEWFTVFPVGPIPATNRFVRGIEFDLLGRAVNYHLRHPEDMTGKGEIVPADMIQYVFEVRRAGQLHGEPFLVSVIERILQDSRLIETELKASISTAAPSIVIKSAGNALPDTDEEDGQNGGTAYTTDIQAGSVTRLYPDESAECFQNTRPNQMIAPFRGTVRGDIAAATRTSRGWLDRDPSQANYSSMRMDQLLSKRILQSLKDTVGRGTAGNAYVKLFPWLLLKCGRPLPKDAAKLQRMMQYSLRPDQPEYVDPLKDVQAAQIAIASNLSTYAVECSARGKDWEEVFRQRARERDLAAQLNLPEPSLVKTTALTDEGDDKDQDDEDRDARTFAPKKAGVA